MSSEELLSKEEIDTLLSGVDAGDIETETAAVNTEAVPYDLARQDHLGAPDPDQVIVNDRFARYSSISMFNLLRETLEIQPAPIEMMPYAEYRQTLTRPSSINLVKIEPFKGYALLVLKSDLVALLIDRFFGGEGQQMLIEDREFTATEDRIIQKVMSQIYADLTEAWSAVQQVKFVWQQTETNPVMADDLSDHELVTVSTFEFRLNEDAAGHFQVVIPYAMLEPLRHKAETEAAGSEPGNKEWSDNLLQDIMAAPVPITCKVSERRISLREVLGFKVGDIIPITMPEAHELIVRDIPLFKTRLGTSNEYLAMQIIDTIRRDDNA